MAQKNYKFFNPNYKEQIVKCKAFLESFESASIDEHPIYGQKKYMIQLVKKKIILLKCIIFSKMWQMA